MSVLTSLLLCTTLFVPSGEWRWPLGPPTPQVVRGFSPPPVPWGPGHRGVDLAARPGQSVHAAGPGLVTFSGHLAHRGVVAITHGSLRTTYLPVTPSVPSGRHVRAGTRIGTLAPFTHCPLPCLHWGLRKGATYLDPLALVRPQVRLLPRWTPRPTASKPPVHVSARDATTAGGGALTGMLLTLLLAFIWRSVRPRHRPTSHPPDVIDLTQERLHRRPR
jgi:murein DD-endopeptidase MepM/ murein hydrolase activator NlpD